jgi:hypothetical protein
MLKQLVYCVALLLGISACSMVKKIDLNTIEQKRPELVLPAVDIIHMEPVEWKILTQDNANDYLQKETIIFGLNDQGYESLSLNISRLKALIVQQKAVIKAYEEYYKRD